MRVNKTKKVMWHLQEYGSITTWEAIKLYGATRLSSIIYNLRYSYNMNIKSEKIDFTDMYGDNSYFVKYVLEEE